MCKLYQANMIYDNFLGLYYLSTVYKLCREEVLNVHLWKWKGYLDLKKINTCTCVNTFYHIYKLWCYTGISGSEKSHNNTHEKNIIFFHVCWYSQSAADMSLAFGTTQSGWWMNGKAFMILNKSSLLELSRIMEAKTLKNLCRWQTVRFKLS